MWQEREMGMSDKSKNKLFYGLYIALCAVMVLPLMCRGGFAGDIAGMWQARVEEVEQALAGGRFLLFPSAETVLAHGGQYRALDSNLWLLVPVLFARITGNVPLACLLFQLLLQVGTVVFAAGFFGKLFPKREMAFFGTLLYVTSPYCLYLTYDLGDLGSSVAFMLIPLFAKTVFVVYTEAGKRKWCALLTGAVVWAGIAYGDWVVAFVAFAVVAFSVLWYRKWWGLALFAGVVLYLPGLRYVARYLIKGNMEQWNFPLTSIMPKGYALGDFFTGFPYREHLPGAGPGLLGALLLLIGMCYVKERFSWDKKYHFPVCLSVGLMLVSTKFFPWDLLQRVGMPFVRMVSMWESPAVFFGCAMLPLSVLGAYALGSLPEESDAGRIVKAAVAVVSAGVAVFLGCTIV